MKTYDYYKTNPTGKVYYDIYWFNGDDGVAGYEVTGFNRPFAVDKGVWNVIDNGGWTTYVPEGATNFDENADKLVWGRLVKGDSTKAGQAFEEYIDSVEDLDEEFC